MVNTIRVSGKMLEIIKYCPKRKSYSDYLYDRLQKSEINRLNEIAIQRTKNIQIDNGKIIEILLDIIEEEKYEIMTDFKLNKSSTDTQIILIKKDGLLINCWLNAPTSGINEGGQGFDNQTELHKSLELNLSIKHRLASKPNDTI